MRTRSAHKVRMLGVEDVRESNELKLLHVIRDRQPISRAELVASTGLRAGTVSVVVNRLLRAAVIHEADIAPSNGGRPATYLQINAEKVYVVGMSIGVGQTTYGVSDFNGRILSQRSVRAEADAAAFGHIPMDPQGPECSCGSIGCWEMLASDCAVLSRFMASGHSGGENPSSVRDLISLAQSGHEGAHRELLHTASLIGRGLKCLAQGLSPEVIVMGGQIAAAWPTIEPALQAELHGEYLLPGISQPQLRPASVEQPSWFGAFPIALRRALHCRSNLRSNVG